MPQRWGARVSQVAANSAATEAGIRRGDLVVSVGDLPVRDNASLAALRTHYAGTQLRELPVVVRRGPDVITLRMPVRLMMRERVTITELPNASAKALAVRNGIMHGNGS